MAYIVFLILLQSHVTLDFKQLFIYSAQADIDEILQVKIKMMMIKQINKQMW